MSDVFLVGVPVMGSTGNVRYLLAENEQVAARLLGVGPRDITNARDRPNLDCSRNKAYGLCEMKKIKGKDRANDRRLTGLKGASLAHRLSRGVLI
jgi:hypothetical protein